MYKRKSGDGPLWGDTPEEQRVPDVLKKVSDSNSKRRITRQLYGYDPESLSELEDIAKLRDFKPGEDIPTEYIKNYFTDFKSRVNQGQRADMPGGMTKEYMFDLYPDLKKYVKHDKNFLGGMKREISEVYVPGYGFRTSTGEYPTKEQPRFRTVLNYPKDVTGNPDFISVHSHPSSSSASDEDRQLTKEEAPFIVTEPGEIIRYGKNPAEDKRTLLESIMPTLEPIIKKYKKK